MNREIAHWLQGNVDGVRYGLDHHIRRLLLTHRIPGAGEDVDQAVCALNRIHQAISDLLPLPPRFPLRTRKPMTEQQTRIRAFIEAYHAQHDCAPTVLKITEELGFSSSEHTAALVTVMVKNGWLAKENRQIHARPTVTPVLPTTSEPPGVSPEARS